MNAIGIEEGTIIAEPQRDCDCVWMMLTSYPAQYKLQKKCGKCKEHEKHQRQRQMMYAEGNPYPLPGTSPSIIPECNRGD